MILLVHLLKKSVFASADFSSAEAISIEESAKDIASSCLINNDEMFKNSYSYCIGFFRYAGLPRLAAEGLSSFC